MHPWQSYLNCLHWSQSTQSLPEQAELVSLSHTPLDLVGQLSSKILHEKSFTALMSVTGATTRRRKDSFESLIIFRFFLPQQKQSDILTLGIYRRDFPVSLSSPEWRTAQYRDWMNREVFLLFISIILYPRRDIMTIIGERKGHYKRK